MNNLCFDGMDFSVVYEYCFKFDFKCKVIGWICYKYVICLVGGINELLLFYVGWMFGLCNFCFEDYIYVVIMCCEYICI